MHRKKVMSTAQAKALFLANKKLIDRIVRAVCRRLRCSVDEAEDFLSEMYVKLVADDYAVLRQFKGEFRLSTYLTTVVTHHLADYRDCDRTS